MKKWILAWFIILFGLVFIPKVINHFQPIIKEVPIYKVKETIKEIPVHTPTPIDLFIITLSSEDSDKWIYRMEIKDQKRTQIGIDGDAIVFVIQK